MVVRAAVALPLDLVDRYVAGEIDRTTTDAEPEVEVTATPSDSGAATDSVTTADNRYVAVIAGSVLVQVLLILSGVMPDFLPFLSANAAAWIGVLLWFAIPPAVFLDAVALHRNGVMEPPNRVIWPVAAFFIPVIVPAYYLLVRF